MQLGSWRRPAYIADRWLFIRRHFRLNSVRQPQPKEKKREKKRPLEDLDRHGKMTYWAEISSICLKCLLLRRVKGYKSKKMVSLFFMVQRRKYMISLSNKMYPHSCRPDISVRYTQNIKTTPQKDSLKKTHFASHVDIWLLTCPLKRCTVPQIYSSRKVGKAGFFLSQ